MSQNYGMQRNYGGGHDPTYRPPTVVAMKSERAWAVLAHLSTFINTFTGFLDRKCLS